MKPIIRIENLGKQYRIGARRVPYQTLRDSLTDLSRWPLRWLRGERRQAENTIWALKDVSFDVHPGEVVGIVGRNGAGKSTLLKVLSRITEPTTGQVDLYGRVGSLLEVGTGFHAELTGRENIYLNGAILGMTRSEIRRKFDEIVSFAEVEQFIDTTVKHYSSGMYLRLAFAVAAHLDPEILIVDEVLAVGDASFQNRCLGKMRDVARGGRTVLLVSHQLASIAALCPRCIWLDQGQVQQIDASPSVISAYISSISNLQDGSDSWAPEKPSQAFQLRRVRMCNGDGEQTTCFSCDYPIHIEMTIDVRSTVRGLYGYLEFSRMDGTTVLVSDSFDVQPNRLDNLPTGTHLIDMTLPARSLAPGAYIMYLNFTSPLGDRFDIDSPGRVCKFILDDSTSRRGNGRGGFFSTLVEWRVRPAHGLPDGNKTRKPFSENIP